MSRRLVRLTFAFAGALLPAACKRSAPEVPPAAPAAVAPLEVTPDAGCLFTYVDDKGAFATVDKADAVPAPSRGLVRVVNPNEDVARRKDTSNVYVADLNQLLKSGKAVTRMLSREAFETGALALLPPGAFSPRAQPHASGADGGATGGNLKPGEAPVVTIYGTNWCGACRSAAAYLTEKKIPFADKDIEQDPAAARELEAKATQLGIRSDRIPILDVRGRLLIGFDRERLDSLLGETI